jgi:hypothetical protein
VLSLVTSHGRATPLIWLSVWKDELTGQRNGFEDAALMRLAEVLPEGMSVTILADRGFADRKLLAFLTRLGFDYVIRLRGNIRVTAANGERRDAADWVNPQGRARKLRDAAVTAAGQPVPAVVCVHAPAIIRLYSRRWTIEPSFRDTKDLRFGMGLSTVRVSDPQRRERLLLLNAFATVLLTLLGQAGESLGMDRQLKTNTSKTRTHPLFRQGCMLYDLIPNMPDHRLRPLIQRFNEILNQKRIFTDVAAAL